MKKVLMLLLALANVIPLFAQNAAPPKVTAIKAARMFDGLSNGTVTNAVVLVENGKITAAGSGLAIPAGANVIDLGDSTLLPGLIDCHTHLSFQSSENWDRDFRNEMFRTIPEQAHYAAMYARKTIEAGFTTVRDLGSSEYQDVGLRNAINAGVIVGPRMLVAVHAIGSTGGHADSDPIPPGRVALKGTIEGTCNGPAECREAVRYQMKYGADVIKFMPSGGVLSLSDPVDAAELSQEEMNAIVDEAHRWGRKVAAHCHGDLAAKMAIAAGVDSIEHGSFLKPDTLALMKSKGVYLVPTLMAADWVVGHSEHAPQVIVDKAKAASAARGDMFRNAVAQGVKIAFGTDSAVSPHGMNAHEFSLMVQYGMTPAAALRAATSVAATLLGISDQTGSIESGKAADLVAVPGDPLSDIHAMEHPLFVMKGGSVVVGTH